MAQITETYFKSIFAKILPKVANEHSLALKKAKKVWLSKQFSKRPNGNLSLHKKLGKRKKRRINAKGEFLARSGNGPFFPLARPLSFSAGKAVLKPNPPRKEIHVVHCVTSFPSSSDILLYYRDWFGHN